MRTLSTRFNTKCKETGKKINKGELILLDNKDAYCINSTKYKKYLEEIEGNSLRSYIDAQECAMFERYGRY